MCPGVFILLFVIVTMRIEECELSVVVERSTTGIRREIPPPSLPFRVKTTTGMDCRTEGA